MGRILRSLILYSLLLYSTLTRKIRLAENFKFSSTTSKSNPGLINSGLPKITTKCTTTFTPPIAKSHRRRSNLGSSMRIWSRRESTELKKNVVVFQKLSIFRQQTYDADSVGGILSDLEPIDIALIIAFCLLSLFGIIGLLYLYL